VDLLDCWVVALGGSEKGGSRDSRILAPVDSRLQLQTLVFLEPSRDVRVEAEAEAMVHERAVAA
jgi:hypothetical protein